jgi:hypothetical protein
MLLSIHKYLLYSTFTHHPFMKRAVAADQLLALSEKSRAPREPSIIAGRHIIPIVPSNRAMHETIHKFYPRTPYCMDERVAVANGRYRP